MIDIIGECTERERRNLLDERIPPLHLRACTSIGAIVPSISILSKPLMFSGGVYGDGKLMPSSVLRRSWGRLETVRTTSYKVLPTVTKNLSIEAVYGGYLFGHFGHFTLESMARTWWAIDNNFTGPIVFQLMGNKVPEFAIKLLKMAGLNPVFVYAGDCLKINTLIVPDAAFVERSWAHSKFMVPFKKISDNLAFNSEFRGDVSLYVSRGFGVTPISGEIKIIHELKNRGFKILDPSLTSIEDQIAAFASAKFIVGCIGSAMHNVVYARRAEKVIYLARNNSVSPSYPIIDRCIEGYHSTYIYSGFNTPITSENPSSKLQINSSYCLSMLSELDIFL
jgi:capsular polysaccharide biosynthesis protein